MRSLLLTLLLTLLAAATVPRVAAAQPDDVDSFAIVVGSNAAGPGQEDLRFAEDDARRVADVLRELGGYPADHITTVLAPTPDSLLAAIDTVSTQLIDAEASGKKTQVFFYYSGHARAAALVLGKQELALTDLRAKLTALPATLTIVVLDACQSGAFTRVKGAEKTADFSYNSKSGLDASGIAVMASSSESELSQESDFLEGSYFTHHLLVGLRGGGDENKDGRVSLDEAYQYAYQQTLLATSQTAVGGQHVSLEVDLHGQGEVPLTYPEKADATLTLAAQVAGDVLVERVPAQAVLAEVHKEAGASFAVAIPAGKYKVLVREAAVVERCSVTVPSGGNTSVDLSGCDEMPLVVATAKGGTALPHAWRIDFGVGLAAVPKDQYVNHLHDSFGYDGGSLRADLSLGVSRLVFPHLAIGARLTDISGEEYTRGTKLQPLRFQVGSDALTLGGQGFYGDGTFQLFGEAGAGVTWSRSRFVDETGMETHDNQFSFHLEGAAGVAIHWTHHLGTDVAARWIYSPTVTNLIGDTMDVGGIFYGFAMTYRPE